MTGTTRGMGYVEFFKKVGIVAGAVLAVSAIASSVVGFFSRQISNVVVSNIVVAIADERRSREQGDSLLFNRVSLLDSRVVSLSEALGHPLFSEARTEALDKAKAPAPPPKRRYR